MAKRRLTSRQKRQRMRKIRNRVLLALAVLALASAAMAPDLRAYLTAKIRGGVQAFADLRAQEVEVTLPERKLYALQLCFCLAFRLIARFLPERHSRAQNQNCGYYHGGHLYNLCYQSLYLR